MLWTVQKTHLTDEEVHKVAKDNSISGLLVMIWYPNVGKIPQLLSPLIKSTIRRPQVKQHYLEYNGKHTFKCKKSQTEESAKSTDCSALPQNEMPHLIFSPGDATVHVREQVHTLYHATCVTMTTCVTVLSFTA